MNNLRNKMRIGIKKALNLNETFSQKKIVFLLVTLVTTDAQSLAMNNFPVNNPFEV